MAGNGPAPKANRRRRNKPAVAGTVVALDGSVRGMALPPLGGRRGWHPRTRQWWEAWRRSPQAQLMLTEPDWEFLLDTALLHHLMWSGDLRLVAEVRLRVAKFGATPEDRRRLQMEVKRPDPPKDSTGPGTVTRLADRQRLLEDSPSAP